MGRKILFVTTDQQRYDTLGCNGGTLARTPATDLGAHVIRKLLERSGLKADQVTRAAGELSPGERTRAGLALLQARGVNVLVLDEPTNHLDLAAIEQLEQALESYEGTLLLVTHDRRMLNTVQLDRRWHVEAGTVTELA